MNDATCVEKVGTAVADLSCLIFQTNTTGPNNARITQVVDTATGATQEATEYAGISQENGSGLNNANVIQTIVQLATVTAAGTQTQDGRQIASVDQESTTGSNNATVTQSLALTATASNLASVIQNQNTDGTDGPNTATSIRQEAVSGMNAATLTQAHDLAATVAHVTTATQQQGSPTGGQLGHFEQHSSAMSRVNGQQRENQRLNAINVPNLTQTQYGPMRWGSEQETNPLNSYIIRSTSTQNASSPDADQSNEQYASCDTSGRCTATQLMLIDGVSYSNSCTGSSCHIGQTVFVDGSSVDTATCVGIGTGPGECPPSPYPPPSPSIPD
jgi:hypothetical protein